MNDVMTTAARGAVAGMVGTAMMTMMMRKVAPRVVPAEMRPDEFAPKRVVEWAEDVSGHPHALSESEEMKAAMAAHFTYGSGSGAAYAVLRPMLPGPAPLAGAVFGIALWAAGFEGWMPALGVQPATTEQPPRKWPMPVMAHMVYGASTALAFAALEGALE